IFRGTIDFRRGCSGAKGSENENVLLIDDTVRNQTLPVILCSEEDVEGTHGASIGKLDESLLFYLQTRGLSEDQVYEMMAASRIAAVVALIPDAETREELEAYMERKSRN
ncbi:MAG: SufD family Fe-S cluster assembly protein, partial [Lachnospiraceae bacterium]|nr:SufD family Fe-S cluster assembly protein [Lachnospiraceae bacterium]